MVEALHAPPPRLHGVGWDNGAERVPEAWARSSFLGRTLLHWAKTQARPLHRLYLWRQYLTAAEVLKLQQAYGVPVVSAFGAYAEEFEDHAHGGLHLYHWACRDGLHPNVWVYLRYFAVSANVLADFGESCRPGVVR